MKNISTFFAKYLRAISIFALAFIVVLGASLAFFKNIGLFEVKTVRIEVTGDVAQRPGAKVGPFGLKNRLQGSLRSYGKKKIWDIDIADVKSTIIRDEWVKDVLITRSFPNSVTVIVEPKKVALVLVGSKGRLWPITSDGGLLEALPADALPDVPLLRGEVFVRNKERRKEIVDFVLNLPSEGALSSTNISELSWNANDGISLMLMQPKVEVLLGEDRLDLKVLRVTQVVNYLVAHQQQSRVIDASFSKKVLVRLRKGP